MGHPECMLTYITYEPKYELVQVKFQEASLARYVKAAKRFSAACNGVLKVDITIVSICILTIQKLPLR